MLALRYGPSWPSMSGSGRYERDRAAGRAPPPPRVDPDRPEDLWKALDRGEDPTGETARRFRRGDLHPREGAGEGTA